MKIAIDARMINSSTGRYVERLLHYLQVTDKKNTYVVLVPEREGKFWQPTNPNFSVVTVAAKYYSIAEQTSFLHFLNTLKADLVHFTMPQQPLFYKGAHVTTFHDLTLLKTYNSDKNWLIYHIKQTIGRRVFKAAAKSSNAVITPSEFTKRELQAFSGIHADAITVTYEAADELAAQPVIYPLPAEKYLLYVGQQSDYKNIRRLILAHQELLKTNPDLYLLLVGGKNKSLQNNEAWVQKHKYKQVVFTGFVNDNELMYIYQHARCYVFPSLMEGFGLPGLEAMRAGCPVVSSNATCLPEIYSDAAQYFNPFDVKDMATKISNVITDSALRDTLIASGTIRAAQFSWERMAQQTLAIYESIGSASGQKTLAPVPLQE